MHDAGYKRITKAGTVSPWAISRLLVRCIRTRDHLAMQTSNSYTVGLAYRRYHPPSPFGLTMKDRLHHVYCVGQTGTGKSTLLSNLALQDAAHGTGFCLIDPHGDLAESLHEAIAPPHLYWEVADPECPLGYNPLAKVSALNRPLVASGFIETLKKQWPDAWGARMEHILRYAILALLEQPEADLRDVVRLLTYKGYRRQVIDRITDPQVLFFWKTEFPALNFQGGGDGISPIANKLGAFLAQPTVRAAVCEPEQPLRFRHIMDTGQVLIVNLSKGQLGADIASIVGGLITSTIMLAASTRHSLPELARRPFFLYVDEFPNFTTRSFAGMLSEARKYRLGLVLAHQHLSQTETEVSDAVFGNVGSLVAFRVGSKDAPILARTLAPTMAQDLQSQPNHRATVQIMHHGQRTTPFSASMYPPYRAEG